MSINPWQKLLKFKSAKKIHIFMTTQLSIWRKNSYIGINEP